MLSFLSIGKGRKLPIKTPHLIPYSYLNTVPEPLFQLTRDWQRARRLEGALCSQTAFNSTSTRWEIQQPEIARIYKTLMELLLPGFCCFARGSSRMDPKALAWISLFSFIFIKDAYKEQAVKKHSWLGWTMLCYSFQVAQIQCLVRRKLGNLYEVTFVFLFGRCWAAPKRDFLAEEYRRYCKQEFHAWPGAAALQHHFQCVLGSDFSPDHWQVKMFLLYTQGQGNPAEEAW